MPDINYTLNIDTSRVATAMSEVRSQMNTSFPGGGGLGGFVDTGRAAFSGLTDFGGAAAAGGASIVNGLASVPRLGFSHMPDSMSMVPHYGIVNADASLKAEWMSRFYGPAGAVPFAPPGVSGVEYHGYLMREHIRKFSEAGTEAAVAAGTSIAGFAGGMVGWEAGSRLGAAVGGFGGPLGRGVGWLAGGLLGSWAGESGVGAVTGVFNRERAVTREMGAIVDAGRQLPLDLQRQLGAATTAAARDIGMDPNAMADIMANATRLGTLPKTLDPAALRAQAADMGQAIQDIANTLHTSMNTAQGVMKSMERFGFKGVEGADWLLGQAGRIGMGMSPMGVFGLAMGGAQMGMQAQIGGGFGFRFLPEEAYRATHAGLNREQLQMAGGVTGLAQTMAGAALGNAFGPMGMLQIAAAPGVGFALPGSVEETMTRGIAGLEGRGGGDFMRNVIRMQTHRGEIIRAMGPGRTIEMQDTQLRNMANMLADLTGEVPEETARFLAMQGGANENQAKAMAFRAVNPAAQRTGDSVGNELVRRAREDREREHAARARFGEMEFAHIPIVGGIVHRLRDRIRAGATSFEIAAAARTETETQEWFHSRGLPYEDVSPEAVAEVRAVATGAVRGRAANDIALPTAPGLQGAIHAVEGLTPGRHHGGADVLRRSQEFSTHWANQGSQTISAKTADQLTRKVNKDRSGMERKVREFMGGIEGDPTKTQARAIDIVRGTSLESVVRREGAGRVSLVFGRLASTFGIENTMGIGDVKETLIGYAASERERAKTAAAITDPVRASLDGIVTPTKRGGAMGGEVGRIDLAGDSNDALTAFLSKLTRHVDVLTERVTRSKGHTDTQRASK